MRVSTERPTLNDKMSDARYRTRDSRNPIGAVACSNSGPQSSRRYHRGSQAGSNSRTHPRPIPACAPLAVYPAADYLLDVEPAKSRSRVDYSLYLPVRSLWFCLSRSSPRSLTATSPLCVQARRRVTNDFPPDASFPMLPMLPHRVPIRSNGYLTVNYRNVRYSTHKPYVAILKRNLEPTTDFVRNTTSRALGPPSRHLLSAISVLA